MSHYRGPKTKLDLFVPSHQLQSYRRLGIRQGQPLGKRHARLSNNVQPRMADRSKCSPGWWHSVGRFNPLNFDNSGRETDLDPSTLRAVRQGSTETNGALGLAHVAHQPLE
jgi:hypothetical protein